jgi:FAD:protein FMN transferase
MTFHTAWFEAIGVLNQVTVLDLPGLEPALEIARAGVAALDDACRRFQNDSELARLNASGSASVSPLLLAAIDAAPRSAELTDGLVDPTVGGQLRALGYDRDFAHDEWGYPVATGPVTPDLLEDARAAADSDRRVASAQALRQARDQFPQGPPLRARENEVLDN